MAISNYAGNLLRNHLFRDATWSKSTTRYVALCTTSPSASSTGSTIVEVADANYVRRQLDADDDNWAATTDLATHNLSALTWPAADASYTATHWAIVDASTAGNLLCYGSITGGTVAPCEVFRLPIGDLDITVS